MQTDGEGTKTTDAAVQAAFDNQHTVLSHHAPPFLYPDELFHDQVDAATAQAELSHQQSPPPNIPQVDGSADQTIDQGHV